ncbi:lysosomal alpha-glucosidase [Elysia marginata]|uniref:Lysosomal alpha-glucosidase n=1 Tax=Elysia marginata TaxID=1093978 RepID=A0AAV4IZ89_9GAST|nr:lysosomal alpha-glucosidase [Elysia marginata]
MALLAMKGKPKSSRNEFPLLDYKARKRSLRGEPNRIRKSYFLYATLMISQLLWTEAEASPSHVEDKTQVLRFIPETAPKCTIEQNNRFDCWPEVRNATQKACKARGCCWEEKVSKGVPFCYFPANYGSYTASNVTEYTTGITASLSRTDSTIFPPDIKKLTLKIDFQTESRLRIKILDPEKSRFEPPVEVPSKAEAVEKPLYKVVVNESPFNIIVTRTSTNATVFDTTGMAPFIFADQFLQIGTRLSTHFLYGLGEHRYKFLHQLDSWRKLVFWTHGYPPTEKNGYGSHPFYLNLEGAGSGKLRDAHGVLLLNSNAAEAILQPYGHDAIGAVTFRSIGGVIDLFVLLGPSPLSVASQYAQVVGRPYMPPFWSLGFHLCRWGYNNSTKLQQVIKRNREANMPYDVQWGDIDYMDQHKDWTFDKKNFSNLPDIVNDLHKNKQRYIIMADPAISSTQPSGTYKPFDDGRKMDIFIKDNKGKILIGKVWPGKTAFPDFFHPKAYDYWLEQAREFHKKIPFDGLWIDMNEPSNFVTGSVKGCSKKSKLDNPPYVPGTIDQSLIDATLCPSGKQYLSSHYDLQNMYGWSQANVSRGVLDKLYSNKRSPIITRSTFVGSGKFAGHWLGDNNSSYSDMAYSIDGMLNFNLFAIPQVGADICGFQSNTSPELCTRWHQLGVFYPFMRNHNTLTPKDQDPASFKTPYIDHIRKALQLRYQLLAVLYTNFYIAHTEGLPIVRPLFFLYPAVEGLSHQFMWTDQLLVSPVLAKGASTVEAFLPQDIWYDLQSGVPYKGQGKKVTLNAPLDTINVHIKGGSILPLLPATVRTDLARQQKFTITVAPSNAATATGQLYWDDGESRDSIIAKKYSLIEFKLEGKILTGSATMSGYKPASGIIADKVVFLGIKSIPSKVTVNTVPVNFRYEVREKKLTAFALSLNMLKPFTVTWT